MKLFKLKFLLFFAIIFTFNAKAEPLIKVFETRGEVHAFFGENVPPRIVKKGDLLRSGNIIATATNSAVVFELEGNGVVVLGPNGQLMIGKPTRLNKRHFRLFKGRVHFQTKGGIWRNRSPGAFFTIRDGQIAYMGKRFGINFTKKDRALIVKESHVNVFSLTTMANQTDIDTEEEVNPNETQSFEEDIDYLALIEEQSEGKGRNETIKIDEQNPINFKAIFRGVHVQENQFINTDSKSTVDGESDSVNTFDQFNPKDNYFDIRLEWNSQHKSGGGYLFTSGWLEYGNQDNVYKKPLEFLNFRKEGRNNIEISELFYLYSWDNTDITLGKKVVKTGFGFLISPADEITPKDLYDPLDTRFIGNFLIGIDYYTADNWTYSYTLLPYYLPDKAPQRLVTDINGDLTTPAREYPVSDISSFRHYFQAKSTISGWDVFLGYLYGPYTRPVYKQKTSRNPDGSAVDCDTDDCQIIEEYVKVHRFSSGFSTNFSIFNVYSELVYQHAEAQKDDNFFSSMIGTRFKIDNFIFNRTEIIFEYAKEKVTDKQETEDIDNIVNTINPGETKSTYIESSRGSNYQQNTILARVTFELSEKLNFSINTSLDLEDSSRLYIGELYWIPKDNWSMQFNYEKYIFELESNTSTSTRSTPFGEIEVDIDESTELTRTYDRFTLKLSYSF